MVVLCIDSVYEFGWLNLIGNVVLFLVFGVSVFFVCVCVLRCIRFYLVGGVLVLFVLFIIGIGVSVNDMFCFGVVKFDVVDSLYGVVLCVISNLCVIFIWYVVLLLVNMVIM